MRITLLILLWTIIVLPGLAQATEKSLVPDKIVTNIERPVMISLNGEWKFQEDPDNTGEANEWFTPGSITARTSVVPLPWQLAFDDLHKYLGAAWYERAFTIPVEQQGRKVIIHFEGVDYTGKVWINGKLAGEHGMELAPFRLDITSLVRFGEPNTVTVRAFDNETGRTWGTEQSIALSGIYRDAWVEVVGQTSIADIFMLPDIDNSAAEAQVEIDVAPRERDEAMTLKIRLKGPDGREINEEKEISLPAGSTFTTQTINLRIAIPQPVLWDLDNPKLYEVNAALIDNGGAAVDEAKTWFGMRKMEVRGKQFYLNNHPIYISGGWIDQSPVAGPDEVNWARPGPYEPLSDEEIIRSIKMAKELNIVQLRRIMRTTTPRFIYWADRLGMLIRSAGPWVSPSGIINQDALKNYKKDWTDIVRRQRNSPSMVMYDLFTENNGLGGGEFAGAEGMKKLTKEVYDHVHALNPAALLVDNACGRSMGFHGNTDYHDLYYLESEAWIRNWAEFRRAHEAFTSYEKPAVISLTSNLDSRIVNAAKARRLWGGKDPWWFMAMAHITADSSFITGYTERFDRWGFKKMFGDWDEFTRKSDWYHFYGVKFQTEQMRKNPELAGFLGFIYDCVPHFLGAIDPFLDKKVFADELAPVYAQDVLIPDTATRNYWSGETVVIPVHFSHFGKTEIQHAKATWRVEGDENLAGEIAGNIKIDAGVVRPLGVIAFTAPPVDQGKVLKIRLKLEQEGRALAVNSEEVQVFPTAYRQTGKTKINLMGFESYPEGSLHETGARLFENIGYEPHIGLDEKIPVSLSHVMDAELEKYVNGGGTAILLTSAAQADFLTSHGLTLVGTAFHPGGITGTFYVRRDHGLFERIPFENPMGWPFYRALPQFMVLGIPPENKEDILAGGYGSFLRNTPPNIKTGKPFPGEIAATLAQFQLGQGRLIICAFDLLGSVNHDPVATIMLHDLIKYAQSDFRPGMNLARKD